LLLIEQNGWNDLKFVGHLNAININHADKLPGAGFVISPFYLITHSKLPGLVANITQISKKKTFTPQ
jgi:hypothetical protein